MPFIPLEIFANLPQGTVSAGGTSAPAGGTVETWTVVVSAAFPTAEYGAQQYHAADPALPSELFTVNASPGGTGTQSWTVTRGAEGTAPVTHSAGFSITQVVSAGALAAMQYPAWQFPVQQYGAQGDGKVGTGGTGASGQAVFTDAGAAFVNAPAPAGDVNKVIVINQGTGSALSGSVSNPFAGTITAVNSATSVTLSANLDATCASAPYVFGTDDAAAINTAVLAAAQWAVSTGNYKAQVVFEPQLYMLGALVRSTTYQWPPFNTGLNYTYNTHVPIPFSTQYARKLILDFIGVGDASEPDFWGSAVPSVQGTCLVSGVFATGQPDATFGQMSVIGTPSNTTNIGTGGITNGGFANVLVNVTGISAVTPFNGSQHGFDFRWAAQANIQNAAALAFAPVNVNSQTVGGPWLRQTNLPANGVAVGLALPINQNNDNCNVGIFSAEGIAIGMTLGEHATIQRLATIYCTVGVKIDWTLGAVVHGGSILYWSCEAGGGGLLSSAGATSQYPLFIGNADFEAMQSYYVSDTGYNLTGTMFWQDLSGASSPASSPGVNGAAHYNIVNNRMYPGIWAVNAGLGIPAPPAAPASATAQQNTAYRNATVYVTTTTGVTAFAIGPTNVSLTSVTVSAGAGVAVPIRVPGGWWYSVTYTGTPTATWVLE